MSDTAVVPYDLRCEYLSDPIGLDVRRPRLSWKLRSARDGAAPAAARVVVTTPSRTSEPDGADEPLWDSGDLDGAVGAVEYDGPPLGSRRRCRWTVTITDDTGATVTSVPASFELGLLDTDDWGDAAWISFPRVPFERPDWRPSPQLRTTFAVGDAAVVRARLYVTALGLYEAHLNGHRVGDGRLTPGWTDYEKRVQYQSYDVTDLVAPGDNALGAVLGDGWHSGSIPYSTKIRNRVGAAPQLLARLEVDLADGSQVAVVSDETWRGRHGPVLASDRYRGERYDARLEADGWATAAFDAADWAPVERGTGLAAGAQLVGVRSEPVRATQEVPAVAVTEPLLPGGAAVVDFGQNLVGWCRLAVESPFPGLEVSLRHGETLSPDGTLYTTNLWDATMQSDHYVVRSGGPEVWEPAFTIHGFRYVEVLGYPGPVTPDALTAVVAHSDMRRTGTFRCSNEMVNQLVRNIDWCQRGNFVEAPTDCPQRAERMGWMGDAQLFAPTGAYLYDVAPFFTKWLADVRGAQSAEGAFPNVVPGEGVAALPPVGAPGWGDAGVIVPWLVYRMYGDRRLLEESFPTMRRWVDFLHGRAGDGLVYDPEHAWGDWLAVPPDQYAATTKDVLGTLYFAHSADTVARAAAALGHADDADRYRRLFDDIAAAFRARFVDDDGRVAGGTQTVHALAIRFGVLTGEDAARAAKHLVADIDARGGHLSTGIVGTAHLLPALTEAGHLDVAYRLLENETFPSWGYSIANGATTIWERWDGWTKEHGFQTPAMNSFNHYALGSVGVWLFDTVAGIAPDVDGPGFERVRIAPQPGGTLTWAEATLDTVRGEVSSRWERDGHDVRLDVTVPPGVQATVVPPGAEAVVVGGGRHTFHGRAEAPAR